MQMFTIQISLSPHHFIKVDLIIPLLGILCYSSVYVTEYVKSNKMILKTLYNSDCHDLAVLKTLDNLGFSIIILFASCHPMNFKTNWKNLKSPDVFPDIIGL